MRQESFIVERRSSDPVVAKVGPMISRPTSPAFSDASSFDSGEPAWWVEVEDLYDTYHFDSRRTSMSSRASVCSVRSFMSTFATLNGHGSRPMSPDSSHLNTPRPMIAPLPFTDDWADLGSSRSRPQQPVFIPMQPSSSSGASRSSTTTIRHRKLPSIEEAMTHLKRTLFDSLVEPDVEVEVEIVAGEKSNLSPELIIVEESSEPLRKKLNVSEGRLSPFDGSLVDLSAETVR
ncbi:hypothetical protein [Phaffia rhodozyma]|uniref:Uncharacterized protein n=1 Tax=Phaffia rhodozyma TaxID=264483 RepID=A0A0F7SHX9_PHARH|nr:hypothetical protein [Phaffia rhodozyma]